MPDDVLIVEDELLIAFDLESILVGLGVSRVRNASSVVQALRMIAERAPDFALLNIDLGPEASFAVAERLQALGIAFVFVSGYGRETHLPQHLSAVPRLGKPYSVEMIASALRSPR